MYYFISRVTSRYIPRHTAAFHAGLGRSWHAVAGPTASFADTLTLTARPTTVVGLADAGCDMPRHAAATSCQVLYGIGAFS